MADPSLYRPKPLQDSAYESFTVEHHGAHWVTLNRPESLNAMSRTMMLELQHYFGELYTRPEIRAVCPGARGRLSARGSI